MKLSSTRIITTNVQQLVAFYGKVTGLPVTVYTEDFAELRTANATLAFGSTRTLALFGGMDIAEAASNRSVIIEFFVDDVDKTYSELTDFLKGSVVQPPTTMPWGNRSLLFRDPDGNLVNFFTPVAPEAKQRFNS
jgi:predicted enzyme related to lactoylglutathione lyase